jgi:hypothetical protein
MEIVTKRARILNVVERWKYQYQYRLDAPLRDGRTPAEIEAQLRMLDLTSASEDDVAQVIGNNVWTRLECDECGASVERLLCFDASSLDVCDTCLRRAVQLLNTLDRTTTLT